VDKTITEVRNISHNLIPEELNFGLFNALDDMANKINEAGGARVAVNIPEDIRRLQLTRQNELSIYRIVQEVLNNMIKHAHATQITLDMERMGRSLRMVIKDNGKGFDTTAIHDSKGIGWKNISARVHLLNGDLHVRSERLSGTTIEISIPA
jgi:signal transduction histidine kinase